MKKIEKLVVFPVILVALLGTASLTALVANWDKIMSEKGEDYLMLEEVANEENEEEKEAKELSEKQEKVEPKILQTVISSGLKVDLLGCEKTDQIVCKFYLTAIHQDTPLDVYAGSSRMIVDGQQYGATATTIGNFTHPRAFNAKLIKDVRMKSALTFPLVEDAENIAVIEIGTYFHNLRPRFRAVQIRDISL